MPAGKGAKGPKGAKGAKDAKATTTRFFPSPGAAWFEAHHEAERELLVGS
jgi:hypothetical protein